MASSMEPAKILCFLCNTAKGIYKCQGCSQVFCTTHSNEHRNELYKQLEEISMTHDLVYQTLNQQMEKCQKDLLTEEINLWESKSVGLIRERAEKMRQELSRDTNHVMIEIKQQLYRLSNEMKVGRELNDFSEFDLQQWTQKLEELKADLLNTANTTIQEDSFSLVNYIYIHRPDALDIFERTCDHAQIRDNGRLVIKDSSSAPTEVRGKGKYSNGTHKICFRIEELMWNGWIFFGIISKTQAMQSVSFHSRSAYGWANENEIYSGGEKSLEKTLDIIQNDTIVLKINCDKQTIQLWNQRLDRSVELSVDIQRCPFPWQFHLNLHSSYVKVRIVDPCN